MSTTLEDMKVDELRERAKSRGVRRYSRLTKKELISALKSSGDDRADAASRETRPGETLVTQDHDVIRRWAEARGAQPATVPGSEHDGHLGVLRMDFPGYGGENLQRVAWDDWFATFDARGLNFIYQEHTSDGSDSNFFRLENPNRNDG